MSGTSTSGSSNGTTIVSGPDLIQISDFYVHAGILHPLIVGSIATIALFLYLRVGSNRCIARKCLGGLESGLEDSSEAQSRALSLSCFGASFHSLPLPDLFELLSVYLLPGSNHVLAINIFDWVINVALGSTLAGIVNGNSLVRGLMALATMLAFQYITSTMTARLSSRYSWFLQGPPLVIVFRGEMLMSIMKKHRMSIVDVNASLRQAGIVNVCQVECAIIEPNGTISIFTIRGLKEANVEPDALMCIDAYRKLCDLHDRIDREPVVDSGQGRHVVRDEEKSVGTGS